MESPLQPWMIDLLCKELSRSRSVRFFNTTLFQDAVCRATVLPHREATSHLWLVFGSSKKCLS